MVCNGKDDTTLQKSNNISRENSLCEVKMDDIHLESSLKEPFSLYGTQLLGNRIINLVETDM